MYPKVLVSLNYSINDNLTDTVEFQLFWELRGACNIWRVIMVLKYIASRT